MPPEDGRPHGPAAPRPAPASTALAASRRPVLRRSCGAAIRARISAAVSRPTAARTRGPALAAAALLLAAFPAAAAVAPGPRPAAPGSDLGPGTVLGGPPPAQRAEGRGFLFGPPAGYLGFRLGRHFARAESDIYSFSRDLFTLDDGDFDGGAATLELGLRLGAHADAVAGLEYGRAAARSEYRDYVGEDDLPIEQETRVTRAALTAGLRFYPFPNGRRIGRLAWIPPRVAPFVGAAGGLLWYRFAQEGDFVDFEDLAIFRTAYESSGFTPVGQVFGGVDVRLSPRLVLAAEARQSWAAADLDPAFQDFEPIDLAGLRTTVGLHWRF